MQLASGAARPIASFVCIPSDGDSGVERDRWRDEKTQAESAASAPAFPAGPETASRLAPLGHFVAIAMSASWVEACFRRTRRRCALDHELQLLDARSPLWRLELQPDSQNWSSRRRSVSARTSSNRPVLVQPRLSTCGGADRRPQPAGAQLAKTKSPIRSAGSIRGHQLSRRCFARRNP